MFTLKADLSVTGSTVLGDAMPYELPEYNLPLGVVHFCLHRDTLERIKQFQQDHPDITIADCSYHLNKAIITMIEEYDLTCQKPLNRRLV
jgi:hypothetical protein